MSRKSVNTTILFKTPQRAVASFVRDRLDRCESASLVAGFVTTDGIDAIGLLTDPKKLELLVIGAGTYKAFEACDQLLDAGVQDERLRVHLGSSRPVGGGFAKFHPMLHSKVYLMEMKDGSACAFIGSHNLTGFAMRGLNGEASVLLEGPSSANEFEEVRGHIGEAARKAVKYDRSMKDAYNWWAVRFLGGLKEYLDDRPRDNRGSEDIIVVLAECAGPALPGVRDTIYFEIPEAIRAMGTEVHLYLFDQLPATPALALNQTETAKCVFHGEVVGLEGGSGGLELLADWQLRTGGQESTLAPTTDGRVRPRTRDGRRQVRAEIHNVGAGFEYGPVPSPSAWVPVLDDEDKIVETDEASHRAETPQAGRIWQRVNGLIQKEESRTTPYRQAVERMSAESGSYTLLLRRVRATVQ